MSPLEVRRYLPLWPQDEPETIWNPSHTDSIEQPP